MTITSNLHFREIKLSVILPILTIDKIPIADDGVFKYLTDLNTRYFRSILFSAIQLISKNRNFREIVELCKDWKLIMNV